MYKTTPDPLHIKFFCNECKKDIDECKCPDLVERFTRRFAGSVIEKEAAEAVREARG